MRFWDSSALVPLFVAQAGTAQARELYRAEHRIAVWFFSDLEIRSALARLEREGAITVQAVQRASEELERMWDMWTVVVQMDAVKARAQRLVAVHSLRAAEALQLAAALVAVEDRPLRSELVTLDGRLADVARREGFRVLLG